MSDEKLETEEHRVPNRRRLGTQNNRLTLQLAAQPAYPCQQVVDGRLHERGAGGNRLRDDPRRSHVLGDLGLEMVERLAHDWSPTRPIRFDRFEQLLELPPQRVVGRL